MDVISMTDLQDVCHYEAPYDRITPKTFANFVVKSLQGSNVCSHKEGKHTFSPTCNERLCMLSAVQACFEFHLFCQRLMSFVDREVNNPSACKRKKNDNSCVVIGAKYAVGNETCDDGQEEDGNKSDLCKTKTWFKETSDKFANKDFIHQLLSLEEKSRCLFTSHIVRKIVCSYATHHDKVAVILGHIVDNWKKNKTIHAYELGFIRMFMSDKNFGDKKVVRKHVYQWFLDQEHLFVKSCFIQKLTDQKDTNFQDNLLLISVVDKMLKYSVSCGEGIPAFISTFVTNILSLHKNIFWKNKMGRSMFLKFLKAFNNFIHFQLCVEKTNPPEVMMKSCMEILEHFPSLFEMCETNGYLTSMSFWESKDLNNIITYDQGSQPSPFPNVVVVREMIILAIKSSAVLSIGEHGLKGGGVRSIQEVCLRLQSWMMKHFDLEQLREGWIPVLFGDQDDKWITVLLCLLIVYQNSCHETIDLNSGLCGHDTCENSSSISESKTISVTETSPSMSHQASVADKGHITETFWKSICPHRLFFQFVKFISFDHLVVSDLLMSPETQFLQYFNTYLVYLNKNWYMFVNYCQNDTESSSHLTDSKSKFGPMKERLPSESKEGLVSIPASNAKGEISGREMKRQNCHVLKHSPPPKVFKSQFDGCLVSYTDSDDSDSEDGVIEKRYEESKNRPCDEGENQLIPTSDISHLSFQCGAGEMKNVVMNDVNTKKRLPSVKLVGDIGLQGEECMSSSFKSSSSSLFDNQLNVDVSDTSGNETEDKDVEHENDHCEDSLESVMTMMIRLRLHIERLDDRRLIPYATDVLVSLLLACEDKYENSM